MPCLRIAVLQLIGASHAQHSAAFDHALAKAESADVIVLDLFASRSLNASLLRTLSVFHRPVRIVGANRHLRTVLRFARIDTKCVVVEHSVPLLPRSESPGVHYLELEV